MSLDSMFMCALAREIETELKGSRVDKIQQPERDQLVFSMRGERNVKLLLSCASGTARVHITRLSYENPQQPPMFCMLLRKHLQGSKLVYIDIIPGERILNMHFEGYNEFGVMQEKRLIFEIVGGRSNISLCDSENRLIDCLHRSDSEKRRLLPGLFYRPPEPIDKPCVMKIDEEELNVMLEKAPQDAVLDKWIFSSVSGISPLIAREIVCMSQQDCDIQIKNADKASLVKTFFVVKETAENGNYTPTLLSTEKKVLDFSFIPISQYGSLAQNVKYNSLSELLEAFCSMKDKAEHMRQRSQSLMKTMKNARDKISRKLENQRRELALAGEREHLRVSGDIITANLYRIKKGDRALKTQNFYDENCADIEIRLDPLLTPQENAARYYKNYKKAKTAEKVLAEQIYKGERELDYCESVIEEITRAETPTELADIRQELVESGYISKPRGKQQKRQPSKPLHFISKSGIDIYIGKNNVQNDRLTFKSAMRSDMWLHTQKIHGSHVIIACAGKTLDSETLKMAASAAAYYSKARDSANVPVDYTLIKYVKKPSGGKPGAAIYTDYRTIFVHPKMPE